MQTKLPWMGITLISLCLLTWPAAIGQTAQVVLNCQGRLMQEPPAGVVLISGYKNERCMGVDSSTGRIWKDQGLEIRYEGGMGAGNRVDRNSSNLAWSREHTTDTRRVQVAMTKDRVLLITFSPMPRGPMLNFYATVRSEEDIADALLMVLGNRP